MKGRLTISRPSYGDGRKKISIQVKDENAGIRFLEMEVDLDKFTNALTGLCEQECDVKVTGLQNIGKKIERSKIEFEMTEDRFNKEVAKRVCESLLTDGWQLRDSFSSQGSFFKENGKNMARANIVRWV